MTLKPVFIAIPLAFDYPSLSWTSVKKSGTQARIESCYTKLRSLGATSKSAAFVVTANKPPNPHEERVMCISQLKLIRRYYSNDTPIYAEPTGWGTESEIKSAIAIITKEFPDHDITIIIATNWAHMWRVKLLVSMYKPKRWKCIFVTSKHHFSLWSHLREIPATIITFGRWFLSKDTI